MMVHATRHARLSAPRERRNACRARVGRARAYTTCQPTTANMRAKAAVNTTQASAPQVRMLSRLSDTRRPGTRSRAPKHEHVPRYSRIKRGDAHNHRKRPFSVRRFRLASAQPSTTSTPKSWDNAAPSTACGTASSGAPARPATRAQPNPSKSTHTSDSKRNTAASSSSATVGSTPAAAAPLRTLMVVVSAEVSSTSPPLNNGSAAL